MRISIQAPDNECEHETKEVMRAICPWDRPHSETYIRCYEAVYAMLREVEGMIAKKEK
jgi:hypothetical protein